MQVKLVRSKMKKMIEETGEYKTVNISRGMYKQLLAEKIIEEAYGLAEAVLGGNNEEIENEYGDLLQVMHAVFKVEKLSSTIISGKMELKKEERGDFISNLGIIMG